MFAYDKTFDPEVLLGHCDLISWFSDFALYLDTQLVFFSYFFQIMNECDQTFKPNILIGHYDLISWFSDFALYLGTQLLNDQTSFTLCLRMTRPLTLK